MTTTYSAIGIALLAWAPLQAQRAPVDAARASDRPYVMATGEATVTTKPDQATIDIGVVTQGMTAAAVASQNAKQTDAVLADLRKLVSSSDQLRTTSYSVHPNYQAPKPGATPKIDGYTATNVVEVQLTDLTQVGKVIDTVLQSGANNIQRLQFGLKNPQAARSQALREAAVRARANAEAIAAGLGARVLGVLAAEENSGQRNYPLPRQTFMAVAASTEIEAGTVEVSATITLTVEISK